MQCGHHFERLKPTTSSTPRPSHSWGWAGGWAVSGGSASSSGGLEDPGPCRLSHEGLRFLLAVSGKLTRLLAGCGMVSGSNDGQALCDSAARGAACPAQVTWLPHGTSSSGLLGVEMCTPNLNRAPFMHQPGMHSPRGFPPPLRALLRPCWLFLAWSWARGESRPCPPVQ